MTYDAPPRDESEPASLPLRMNARDRFRALIVLVAVLFGAWTVWATVILPRLDPVAGRAHLIQSISVRVCLWVVPSAIYLWHVHRRFALDGLRLGLPPSPSHWAGGLGISALAAFAVSLDVARKTALPPLEVWRQLIVTAQLSFPTAPLFEELIFRGVILSELLSLLCENRPATPNDQKTRLRGWLANLSASLVFTGLHWPWWILTQGVGSVFWTNSAGVFLISLVLGMVFIRSRSLWPCVLLHWVNNSLSSLAG